MSWEEYKKKREETSSWEQYKQKRQDNIARNTVTPKTSANNKSSLWDNIQRIAGNTGRTIDNLRLGASRDIKQALNFSFITVDSKNKTEQQIREQRVLGSKELSDTEKALYISSQKSKNILPTATETQYNLILPTKDVIYNQEKVNEIANSTKLEKAIQKDQEKIQENIEKQTDGVSRKLAELAPSIGSMAVGSVASAIAPSLGTTYFTTSAGGNYMQDALDRGMSKQEAIKYGKIMGLMEGATEAISVGTLSKAGKGLKTLIKGSGKEIIKEGTEEIAKNSLKSVLKDYGIGIAENAIQEAIIEPIQEVVAGQIGGQDKANWNDIEQRMLQSGIDGGLTSAILGGANLGIESCIGVVEKTQNGRNVTEQELKNAVQDASKQLDVEKMVTDSVQQQVTKYKASSGDSQSTQNTQNIPNQQIMPTQQKNTQNTNMKTNKMLPMQNYVYEKSDNVKIDKFRQSASQNFDNSIESRNYLNMLEKIITDKDVDIIFDANLKDSQGRMANGSYSNGVITINPNSNRAGEFIAIHELTHAIGTNQMRNIVEQYRKSNKAFDSAVQQLLKNYNTIELTEEAMADVSAQLFGNQEFINSLAQREPNLFRKIYNEIKYLWHQFTGYKNQNQFIEDLQYKWEQAYRNNNKLNETTNYSVAGKKALENIKDAQLRKKAYDIYKKAKQMARKKASNEEIFEKTGWYKDKVTGKMKFNFSDKDMQIVNRNYKVGQEFDLQDILVHETLFEMYPQLRTYKVKIEDMNKNNTNASEKLNGRYNRFTNELAVDINRFKKTSNVEGTLIHEIQHAIQKIEGFAGGTSIRFGKEKYKNNPGEREARDTATRMKLEKYNQKDLSNVMPKSANIDTTILEKMKIGLYNYLSSINNEGEYNEASEIHQKEDISTDSKDNGLVLGRVNQEINKTIKESENNSGSFNLPKLKEGYTRLYRGLENEYDANYDKSKLDNSNGYESWTDSYELAKAYGDNVYYIDVPTSEVKDSIIDEDSQSETYGDRNLLYKNDKPVGIKGKSGNEYMLYTDHDNHGNIKYNKIDNNNSTQDNQGRTLSKEQQEYFKDSKARDKDGNLLEVYHGTNEDFTEFDMSYLGSASGDVGFLGDGFYLATHKGEAKYYGSKIMSGYVNIKNPYNIKDLSKYNGKNFNGEDSSSGLHIKNLVELNPQWRDIEINNTTYGEIADEVTNYLENVEIKKLGIVEDSYGNDSGIMWEISFDGKKTQDESILNYTEEEMIANGLNKHIRNQFGYINNSEIIQYITEENRFNKSIKTLREVLQEKGYDSIVQGTPQDTDEIVIFNSNQFKNVDNTNPTTNPDIRYSLPTKEWQEYLDENYKPTGTRTKLENIKLPVKENSEKSSFSMPTKQNTIKLPQKETNVEKYNRYKQNILKGRAEEVNNLIKNKNETINAIEEQIKKKTQELNSKADKTTKVANNLKMQIENLKQRKTKIENEYNSRIDRKFDKVSKDKINLETKKELGITRKEIQQNLLEDSGIISESLDNAQNISMANMNRTDPIRLQEKVFGRELGTKINNMFFNKIKHNTAEKTRFLNSERNDIKNWGIKARSFESEVLQKYTEKTYVTGAGKEISYTEADLIKDVPNEETRNKIKKASEELRKKYDNYIETANEVLVGLGYDAIPKRKDYVRHFTELNDIFTKFGIPGKLDNALPTDINGITDTFRPGKNFFANAQKRHGNKTTYDAITGIDGYIEGISNLIYHTEDIQRLRALDKYIRESYGEKGFENLENLSEEERNARIQKISENHLSNYVSWLTEYTNNLAGKKSGIDRSVEKLLGRNVYSALDTIKKQTGSNMTGFNIGSALTNFISVTQGASKTKKLALLKGTARTIQNIFNNDGFVDKSDFLTNRFGSDRISNTLWQKVSNVGQVFMSATDYFSSNLIVRSKYYENLAKGMSESEALKKADDFGARILGDRSQGSTANVFNSKMLGILTQFQLEVNNQMDTMIHDTVQDFKTIEGERGALKASMGAVWTLGQMAAYQYIFNNIFQAIAGRRPAFDVIDILKTALGIDDEDEEDSVKDNLQEAAIKLIEGLPFLNLLSEDARVPIASAIPNPISVATGDSTLKDEVSKLVYLLPPTGGSQAKKTIDGVKTVMDGGSYVINSKGEKELRFPVEDKNALSYIKAGTLGKYSLPLAQEYVDRDYKRLSAKQTKTYEESKVPFKEYLEYIEAGLKTNEDKINYLESKEMNTEQKWGIYTNDLFSSTERKEDGGSQLSDAKYITSNGVSKSEYIKIYNKAQKNNIDMPTAKEYKEMKANNVTLKNYIEYKVKVKEATESKRKSKELSSTENLKNADKIQILLDSNYSDKEISGIYANYIKSEKDTEYDIMKATGINIKEYLKYKQQEFTSDKTDDGTLAGKTVNKSKQKKVVEYLNSNIKNGNQRLLLYAMQGYTTTPSQKTQLVNYVKELKIDKEIKLKLYDKFSGFTVYKDGTVEW